MYPLGGPRFFAESLKLLGEKEGKARKEGKEGRQGRKAAGRRRKERQGKRWDGEIGS